MDIEHEPTGTIDANNLVEQSGDNVGNIAAHETSPGTVIVRPNAFMGNPEDPATESRPIIEGLPVIGAEAENTKREVLSDVDPSTRDSATEDSRKLNDLVYTPEGSYTGVSLTEAREVLADEAGTEAMVREVGQRAEALVPNASKELQAAIKEQAVANFRDELESKKAERQAAVDTEAQAILDKLKSGESLDELEKVQPATVDIPKTSETPGPDLSSEENAKYEITENI